MRRIGSSAMEPFQGCARLPPELVQARFVHEHDIGGRDYVAEPPAQLAEVPRPDRLNRQGVIQSLPSQHALVPRPWGRMDGDHHECLAERLPKHLEFRPTAQAIDDDALAEDAWQRALRPDAKSVDLTLRLGHPADRG